MQHLCRRWMFAVLIPLLWGSAGCMSGGLSEVLNPPLTEHTIHKDGIFIDGKILVIDLGGEIAGRNRGFFGAAVTPDSMTQILLKAQADPAVKAVILRIDSPGGEVTATDIIHHQLQRFKAEQGLPVYSVILSVGASGAYYISSATDRIYIHPTGIVGSIGVLARIPQLRGLANKVGYDEVIIKSGERKDMGHPLKNMPAEEREIFQKLIDGMYERFLSVIVAGRDAFPDKDSLRPLADGRIYNAAEAKALGLVDEIAYLDQAVRDIRIAAGLKKVKVVTYRRKAGRDATLYSQQSGPSVNLINLDLRDMFGLKQPGFYYLWRPAE